MSGSCKIGWSPREIIWLKAALTLPAYDCLCALDDISSMSGRTVSAIRAKAMHLQAEKDREGQARREQWHLSQRGIYIAGKTPPHLLEA